MATVIVLAVLPLLVPGHLRLGPPWLLTGIAAGFVIALVVAAYQADLSRAATRMRRLTVVLTVLLIASSGWMTGLLFRDLVRGGSTANSATTLLSTGAIVWINNNILFGLLYWELDGGGPLARARGSGPYADFAFPQQLSPDIAPAGWQPRIVDYLYLGITNGMAFSPTDVMPLTPKAKLTMAAQELISLVILGLVIARAVNVLA